MAAYRTFALTAATVYAAVVLAAAATAQVTEELNTLRLGDTAKDAELQSLEGKKVKLSAITKDGLVVLVVLRGYPGYQCPLCSRQVAELRKHAKEFAELGARVVLVYPGDDIDLNKRAQEFLKGPKLPEPLMLVIDPEYKLTTLYGLRWDAPAETAYPSTFVLDEKRTVKFRKVSKSHGDRAKTEDVLRALRDADSTSTPAD